MLYKTNILALVGGGEVPKFSPNKITIWDDHQCKIVSQIRFNSEVIKVKIRKDSIIGIIYDKIYILNIFTLEIIDIFQTYENPNGVFSCSNINNDLILAFPNSQGKGKVQIEQYFITYEANKKNEAKIINAHESQIACISINNEGTILATASDKGTLIRIFLISKSDQPIAVLKRGKKTVNINCLVFDETSEIIGCTSDAGTTHLFDISGISKLIEKEEDKKDNDEEINKKDKNKNNKINIKISVNERSFAKYKIKEDKSLLGFYQPNKMLLITSFGTYHNVSYDTKFKCTKLEEGTLLILDK